VTEYKYWPCGPDLTAAPVDLREAIICVQCHIRGGSGSATASNLGDAVRYLADFDEPHFQLEVHELKNFLRCIADSLDHPLATTVLNLQNHKAGHRKSVEELANQKMNDDTIAYGVFDSCKLHGKWEAAVSEQMEHHKLSRSAVFDSLRRAAIENLRLRTIDGEVYLPTNAESLEFTNWLHRYYRDPKPQPCR